MSINAEVRKELITLARRSHARITISTESRPTVWQPGTVRNPNGILDTHFTEPGAWELIASQLESGCEVETITLQKPRGKTGYVIKIDLGENEPLIYVKLELGSGKIFGRSFHYSEYANKNGDKHGIRQIDNNEPNPADLSR